MAETNPALTGFALILAYAIPIGLIVMLLAQALRGRKASKRVLEAEADFDRFAGSMAEAVSDDSMGLDGNDAESDTADGNKNQNG